MPIIEAIRVALRMIWAQKLKSGFSVIGVFVGVTFLIAVFTIVEGMNQYMRDRFSALMGSNTFQVRRYEDFTVGDIDEDTWLRWRRHPRITYDDARALEAGLTGDIVTTWYSDRNADIEYAGNVARDIEIVAATENVFQIKNWRIESGRAFSTQEARAGRPVVVIGQDLATGLFAGLDPIGREVKIKDIPYRIVGVIESQGNIFGISLDKFAVAPPLSPVKRFVEPPNVIESFLVMANDQEQLFDAMAQAEAIMRSRRGLRPTDENNFAVETADALLDFWARINMIMALALPLLVGISLVVGGIVIMNIMLMSVAERTREIGIRKSLGARRRDIRRQFLVESSTLAVAGALAGIGTGLGLAKLIEATTPMPAALHPLSIVMAIALGGVVGIVAGVYPATRAAKLDPVHAMRQE